MLTDDFIKQLSDELAIENSGYEDVGMGKPLTEDDLEVFMKQHEWDADDYSEQIQAEDVYLQAKLNGTEITDEVSYYQHTSGNKRNDIVDGTLDLNK